MADIRYSWELDIPISPGESIREILDERGITQTDFAVRLGRSEKFVSQLINGHASLTHETAIELERVLGVPSSFWNAAEAQYRDVIARREQTAELESQREWAGAFPRKEMAANGWVARDAGPGELLSFFGVSSVDAYNAYWGSPRRLAARMSTAYTADTPAIAAWLRAGEIAAESVPTKPFSDSGLRDALQQLRGVSRLAVGEWVPRITAACAEAGVAVVFVRDLPGTRCYAASWWTSRTRAVIALGLRRKSGDQLWFSLYHEAGHLLLDDRRYSSICELDQDAASEERANRFAADALIPPAALAEFLGRERPTKASVARFALEIGVDPGIVVGRLQNEGIVPFNTMNDLKLPLHWG